MQGLREHTAKNHQRVNNSSRGQMPQAKQTTVPRIQPPIQPLPINDVIADEFTQIFLNALAQDQLSQIALPSDGAMSAASEPTPVAIQQPQADLPTEMVAAQNIAPILEHLAISPNRIHIPAQQLSTLTPNEPDDETMDAESEATPMSIEREMQKRKSDSDSEDINLSTTKKPKFHSKPPSLRPVLIADTPLHLANKPKEIRRVKRKIELTTDSPKYFSNTQTEIKPLNALEIEADVPEDMAIDDLIASASSDDESQNAIFELPDAIDAKNYDKVHQLLMHNPSAANIPDFLDLTPLMHAIDNNDINMINHLCAHGADINGRSSVGVTPLQFACYSFAQIDTIRHLLNKGADITFADNEGKTPLINAVIAAHGKTTQVVELLFDQPQLTVHHKDKTGKTALDYAKSNRLREKILQLIEIQMGKLMLQHMNHDQINYVLITEAVPKNNLELAKALIEKGANVNYTYLQRSPLDIAVQEGHTDMVKLLLNNGASLDSLHRDHLTYAIHDNYTDIVDELLKKDTAKKLVEQEDDEGILPLFTALDRNNQDMINLLISQKADINHKSSSDGYTALHWACLYPNMNAAQLVLNQGAKVNIPDNVGKTPLFYAAQGRNGQALAVVKLLLAHDAQVNHEDLESKTVLDYVSQQEESELKTQLIKLLKKYGAQ